MLYTFGYEGLDIEQFIARLHDTGVQTVYDVRELPLSRKKGFSKRSLAETLDNAGIAYRHLPALGCPKAIRDAYKADADWEKYTSAFSGHLAAQGMFIRELATSACETTACLVCFEADFNFCHRTFVARAAHAQGAPVVAHITAESVIADW